MDKLFTYEKSLTIFRTRCTCSSVSFLCSRTKEKVIANETQSKRSNAKAVQSAPDFTTDIGKPIPADSGRAWMRTYNHGRIAESAPYILHYTDVKRLLDKDSCVGIIYYHGFDGNNWMVLPYGITAEGKIFHTDSVATQRGNIGWQLAKQYVLAYEKMNPGAIKAHFFGSLIHYRMDQVLGVRNIRFQIAYNSRGEQLLMSDADLVNPSEYNDVSKVCPPMCSTVDGPVEN